jgi:hypothetical protein
MATGSPSSPESSLRHHAHRKLSEFKTISEDFASGAMNNNRTSRVIRLEGSRSMAFGSMLSTERRYFLLAALRTALSGSTPSPIFVSR